MLSDFVESLAPQHTSLHALLRDFVAWYDNPWNDLKTLATLDEIVEHYLVTWVNYSDSVRNAAVTTPCDLCGRVFPVRGTPMMEPFTGDNYRWCGDCWHQQSLVYRTLGKDAYRDAWRQQHALDGGIDARL